MATKRKSTISPEESSKKKRKAINLEMKMKIINHYEAGKKVNAIARDAGLAHSTVSAILKDKERIREAVKTSAGFKAIITRQRKGLIHEMEKLLVLWFDDQIQKSMPMSLIIIQTKARIIFETLKQHKGEQCGETFTASHGWFQRFRGRFNLNNRREAVTVDREAADEFIVELSDKIADGNNLPQSIHNADETSILWKKSPNYFHKEEEKFTVKRLASVFSGVNTILLELESMDPNVERFTKVQIQMNEILRCYREIYEEKKKLQSRPH